MRQVALLSVIISLVFACAVPTGAVFALEELVNEPPILQEPSVEDPVLVVENIPEIPHDNEIVKAEEEAVETKEVQLLAPESKSLAAPLASPSVVTQTSVVLPASPLLITAYKASGAHVHAIQLYNNSSNMVPIDNVSLLYVAGGNEYEVPLPSGWIEPRSYAVMAWQGESEYADIAFQFDNVGEGALETIELQHDGYQPLIVTIPTGYSGELLQRFKSSAGNYTTNTSFTASEPTISGGGLYKLPGMPEISVIEILVNPRDCTYGLETADCYDYIKLRNKGSDSVDLGLYRLRSGYSNANSTSSNSTYFSDVLAPGETKTLTYDKDGKRVGFTANDGTVWLEDIYGYAAYDLEVPPYVDSDLTAQTGRSWAYNDEVDQWQWATPAPYETENNFTTPPPEVEQSSSEQPTTLVPCRDDQYRSEETNRCRNIIVASILKPCSEGQYRSEETNRCRSIAATVASVLKPCADDQFRNPVTNRCKKIASADEIALADCGEGRERNPDTNRCRNVLGASTTASTMPFPVEETPEGLERFAGWWLVGAVAVLGAGYGVWEWRDELLGAGRKAGRFVTGKK